MTPRGAARCFSTGVLLLAAASPAVLGQRVFRTEIGVVVLHATVCNERGERVAGLGQPAFTVFENGRPQVVTAFASEDVPVSIGLLLDHSRSVRRSRARIEAAGLVFARASSPQDETFVLDFADTPVIGVPLTAGVQAVENGIRGAVCIGATALRDAVLAGGEYLDAHARRDRRALIVITDGGENASAAERDEVRDFARRRPVALYAIGLLDDDAVRADRGRRTLDELARDTGGLVYLASSMEEASRVALEIARQVRSAYTIAYSPENQSLDGSYRRIRVVARGRGKLAVRTRAGYRAVPGPVMVPEAGGGTP